MIAFALRHGPAQFDLDLDDEGWADLEDLIIAIRFERMAWANFDNKSLLQAIDGMDRFEVRGSRIRAVYGHSIALKRLPEVATPPAMLFHGTAFENVVSILQEGISRMRRQFAHFSSDFDWVVQFLADKPKWAILAINTQRALEKGTVFRKANDHVWLADWMDPRFLTIHTSNEGPCEKPISLQQAASI